MPKRVRVFRYDENTGQVVETEPVAAVHRPRYPLACEALAVHPDQISEAREHDRKNGVPTEYRGDGSPMITDAGHYRRYRRLHGVHFKNAYDD